MHINQRSVHTFPWFVYLGACRSTEKVLLGLIVVVRRAIYQGCMVKKNIGQLLLILWMLGGYFRPVSAHERLGVRVSPLCLSRNSILNPPGSNSFVTKGYSLVQGLGATLDYALQEHYYVGTGASLVYKQVAVNMEGADAKKYMLQWVQIPVTMKLYTSEITLDLRGYAEVGGVFEYKMSDNLGTTSEEGKRFKPYAGSVILGVGMEYDTSLSTSFSVGISWQKGISNVVEHVGNSGGGKVYNNLWGIDLGAKF